MKVCLLFIQRCCNESSVRFIGSDLCLYANVTYGYFMNYADISSIVRESLKCQVSDHRDNTPKLRCKSLSYTSTTAVDSLISNVSELEHIGSRTASDETGIPIFH